MYSRPGIRYMGTKQTSYVYYIFYTNDDVERRRKPTKRCAPPPLGIACLYAYYNIYTFRYIPRPSDDSLMVRSYNICCIRPDTEVDDDYNIMAIIIYARRIAHRMLQILLRRYTHIGGGGTN